MHRRLLRSLLCLAPLIAACGGMSMHDGDPMTPHVDSVAADLDKLSSELASHKTAVAGAKAVADLTSLESDHATKVMTPIDDMRSNCSMMTSCHDAAGKAPDVTTLSDLSDQLKQECANHKASMASAADLTAANAEEDRHQKALAGLADKVKSQQSALTPKAGDYKCSTMSGM